MVDRLNLLETKAKIRQVEQESLKRNIKKALAAFLELNLSYLDYTEFDAEYFKSVTQSRCKVLSANTAKLLEFDTSQIWKRIFILTSHLPPADGFKTDPHFGKPGSRWKFHTYCITESKRGYWYAFSPGNVELPNTLPQILEASSLENLREQIINRDGGDWLTASETLTTHDEYLKYGPSLVAPTLFDYVCEISQTLRGLPLADAFHLRFWQRQNMHPKMVEKLISVFLPVSEAEKT